MVGRGRECPADCMDVLLLTCVSLLDSIVSNAFRGSTGFLEVTPVMLFICLPGPLLLPVCLSGGPSVPSLPFYALTILQNQI